MAHINYPDSHHLQGALRFTPQISPLLNFVKHFFRFAACHAEGRGEDDFTRKNFLLQKKILHPVKNFVKLFFRFACHDGVNDIARKILEIGDLKIHEIKPKEAEDADIPIRSAGLAR